MLALAMSESLFNSGSVTEIHHFQKQSYYKKIVEGKSTGSLPAIMDVADQPQPLRMDVDDGLPMIHAIDDEARAIHSSND